MSLQDGDVWTVVSKGNKKRVMRNKGKHRLQRNQLEGSVEKDGYAVELFAALERCKEVLRQTLFYKHLLLTVKESSIEPQMIVCYGVGSFGSSSTTHYSSPFWQLSCALCLQETINVPLSFFDPCTCAWEAKLLTSILNVTVLSSNDRGKRSFNSALFFMPHCPKGLYNNVIWSNWSNLSEIIIVGNSLRAYQGSLMHSDFECPCLMAVLPWLREICLDPSPQDLKQAVASFEYAFNDTYLIYFDLDRAEMPNRPAVSLSDDPELV